LKSKLVLALAVTLWAIGPVAQAQPPEPPPPADAARFNTEIVVTPERGESRRVDAPAATVLVPREALPRVPADLLSEIVSFIPGYVVQRKEFYAGRPIISARGFFGGGEADYMLLLIDGVPIGDVESGVIDWSVVPVAAIQRLEALRGPGASLYGDSAIGGVVQVLTDDAASGGRLTAAGGSFKTFTADGSYSRRTAATGFSVSAATRRTDGAFDHAGGHQLVANGGVDGRFKGLLWRWSVASDTRERDDPGAIGADAFSLDSRTSDPLFRFDAVNRATFLTSLTLRHETPRWRPRGRVYVSARDEDLIRTILLAPGVGDRRARALSTVAIGGSLEGERTLGPATRPAAIRFGIDLSRERLDSSYRGVDESGVIGAGNGDASGYRVRLGGFAAGSWDTGPRVRLSSALRWDHVADEEFQPDSTGHDAWSPRAGVVVRLHRASGASLFAQVSKAFKVPTLDQLFDPRPYPDFRGGTFTISNRLLEPQRATTMEAGASGGSSLRWSALIYRMDVTNEIDFDIRTFSYANIGRSRHLGLELEAGGSWWRTQPSITYALSRVGNTEDDHQLKNVPRHQVAVAAHLELPWAIGAFARFHHTWDAFLDDENAFPIDGPSTIDVRVRRSLGRQLIFVDLLNLTDDEYQEFGFTLADFRGQVSPFYYPGAGRATRVGVTLAF
jgi:outer membrane receptor protein involved in Fe transport